MYISTFLLLWLNNVCQISGHSVIVVLRSRCALTRGVEMVVVGRWGWVPSVKKLWTVDLDYLLRLLPAMDDFPILPRLLNKTWRCRRGGLWGRGARVTRTGTCGESECDGNINLPPFMLMSTVLEWSAP